MYKKDGTESGGYLTVYKPWPYAEGVKTGGKHFLAENKNYFLWALDTPEHPRHTLVVAPANWPKDKYANLLEWIRGCPEYAAKVNGAFKSLQKIAKIVFPISLPKNWDCIDGSKIGKT